jgi:acetylornithine deacetylase/succinyl-diaminopimelate desuccinylase-like protein
MPSLLQAHRLTSIDVHLNCGIRVEQSFLDAGYQPRRQEYQARGKSFANIEAEIAGQDDPQDIVIIGAHYDAARGSPGANDNASGIAALLTLAHSFFDKQISRTLRFVAFTNEERPFLRTAWMGSRVYARRCRERAENVPAMLSLETIGYCSQQREANDRYPVKHDCSSHSGGSITVGHRYC